MPDSLKTHSKILRLVLILSFFPFARGCDDVNGLYQTVGFPAFWYEWDMGPNRGGSASYGLLGLDVVLLYGLIALILFASAKNGAVLIGWRFFMWVLLLLAISYLGDVFFLLPLLFVCASLQVATQIDFRILLDLVPRLVLIGALAVCFRIAKSGEERRIYRAKLVPSGEPRRKETRPSLRVVSPPATMPLSPAAKQYAGCLLGLALGDAFGAPYEGGPIERFLWRFIGKTRNGKTRWTDDTQMALDVAESLLESDGLDQDDLARRFAANYRWSRGYGPAAAKLLLRIDTGEDWRKLNRAVYPEGSFGNGAAMRAPAIGLFYANRPDERKSAAHRSAEITHAHPLALDGAALLAEVTARALRGESGPELIEAAAAVSEQEPFRKRLSLAASWLREGQVPEPKEVARGLGNGIAALDSCITAVHLGLRFVEAPFEEMLDFVIRVGGDTDTIGAMAGAIWGAARGAEELPEGLLERLEERERIEGVGGAVFEWVAKAK